MKWYIKKNSLKNTVYIKDIHKLTSDLNKAQAFDTKSDIVTYLKNNKMSTCACENKPVNL